ncbi:thioesterase family protein [Halomonas saccharevitans]|uniref:Acyl-CoA thioester hydrolase n=1 Tax=Halomonas saccharevitans TaxID=416872 RepID=A0A1I7BVS4_9GAMM|nr:thioesterase family protein [Halomonas saccharevitans]MDT8879243.1 thioesterase family protein [Halomonas saccharevitans]SFT91292.1 acyl-CoA thioester hydrolase [Halomonas saccharevitans]
MALMEIRVASEWVDYNGHMNDAEYARVFSLGVEALMDAIGLDEAGRARYGYTLFTLETHLCYRREVHEGQPLSVEVTVLARDAKRLHVFFTMHDSEGTLLATSEQMLMGIDSDAGRPAPFPEAVAGVIETLPAAAEGDWPELAGRRIGLPAKR